MLTDKQKENALNVAFGNVTVEQGDDLRFLASVDGYINANEGKMPICAFGKTRDAAISTIFDFVSASARERGGDKSSCIYTDENKRVVTRRDGFKLKENSKASSYKPRR